MDVGNVRSWPRMSRRELLALFPDGKTAHLPADGKPLPGYEQALAMIEKRKAGGGGVMMASNAAPRKSKTLFGALFGGGGADEEDNGNDSAPAPATVRPARAAPARQAPAVAPPAPVQQPEAMIAALPNRTAPVPMQAPRPEATVEVPQQAEEVPVAALNVPIPARKPANAVQEAIALASAAQPGDAAAQEIADAGTNPLMTGFVPIPSMRPQQEAATQIASAAAVPSTRPERDQLNPQDAIAQIVNNAPDGATTVADAGNAIQQGAAAAYPVPKEAPRANTQLAMVSKKDEIGELIAPPEDDFDTQPVASAKREPAKIVPVKTASIARAVPAPARQHVAAVGRGARTVPVLRARVIATPPRQVRVQALLCSRQRSQLLLLLCLLIPFRKRHQRPIRTCAMTRCVPHLQWSTQLASSVATCQANVLISSAAMPSPS